MFDKSFISITAGLAASVCLVLTAPLALAHNQSRVGWSVNIGTPYSPPAFYGPPPVMYVQPQPVYVRPYPVYVAPAPVMEYRYDYYGQRYYPNEYRRHKHWEHHRDDDDD